MCMSISVGMHSCMQYNYRPDRNSELRECISFVNEQAPPATTAAILATYAGKNTEQAGHDPTQRQEASRGKATARPPHRIRSILEKYLYYNMNDDRTASC